MLVIRNRLAKQTVEYLEWLINEGAAHNPSADLVAEQYDRAEGLRDQWRIALEDEENN